ncbi:glucose 1-dehydrogenase [Marispirochaeta sp.]|jgi:NAD(P)-dependent dehydrogenase (short-subunit alcohol dehydrogenase family)|uniref:SDR family NAD(P)-dependent oxidoreductase n=1 Tax=Marispirochaeta sp. TaxID=2038653 RepID=UPI0029C800B1|nr:glucose 1-dehydrogenase [Marispirochaeta sp.]
MEKRHKDKVALVFGSASGIGKGVALRLAADGAKMVLSDISAEQLTGTVEECRACGTEAVSIAGDISKTEDIRKVVDFAVKSFGRIDFMVNAAGIVQSRELLEVEEKDWDRIIAINQKGTVFACQIVGQQMVDQVEALPEKERPLCGGKIINFSSIAGRRGRSFQVHYAASKAAIISITQSTAMALAPYGINVNAISPSVVKTPMWDASIKGKAESLGVSVEEATAEMITKIPLARIGTTEDIGGAVSFLCSTDADFITGQTLNVDGGFEMN